MDHVDVVLRPYREGDLPRLQDIAVAAWEPVFASFPSSTPPSSTKCAPRGCVASR